MKEEDVLILAQLLKSMKVTAEAMEEFYKHKDTEGLEKSKKEMLNLQRKVQELL